MRHRIMAGAIIPAIKTTIRPRRAKIAQPIFNAANMPRFVKQGAALPVVVIAEADLVENGGQYRLMGGPAIPMLIVNGRKQMAGAAVVVYPVDVDGNYDATF